MQWVINKVHVDGIGNVIKGFISAYSVNENTTIECNPNFSLALYDTVLDEKQIYKGGPRERFGTCRLLILKNEEEIQQHIPSEFYLMERCNNPNLDPIFSDKVAIDWNYDRTKICEPVRERFLRTIDRIKILPFIYEKANEYISQIIPKTTLGISVRTWKAKHETNIDRAYSPDVYKHAITNAINGMTHVLLSVDNDEYIDEYVTFLSKFPVSVVIFRQSETENYTQHSFVKVIALSKCKRFIGNRISTFSELVFWFSGCNIEVTPLF